MAENDDTQPVSYSDDEVVQNGDNTGENWGQEEWRKDNQQQQSGDNNGTATSSPKNLYVSNLDPKV